MAIAIDYFLKREVTEEEYLKVLMVAVMDEDEIITIFDSNDIESISEFLAMRTKIIMYDNTIRALYPYLTPEFIEDFEVRRKVFDLFNYLKKETGHDIALSRLALATLGIDMELMRLPRNYDDSTIAELREKLSTRVMYIKRLWEYGTQNRYLNFYTKGVRKTVEVQLDDSYDAN